MAGQPDRSTGRRRHRFAPTIALIVAIFSMGGGAATLAGLPFADGSPRPDDADPFFPRGGNSGYTADAYDVELDYRPGERRLAGRVSMTATATQDLSRFYVDSRPNLKIRSASVDGAEAGAEQRGPQDVRITPGEGIAEGEGFELVLDYAGEPGRRAGTGWFFTSDGSLALNEPRGVPSWLPVNDDVRDKALWDFEITVPKRLEAIANGTYEGRERDGGTATYRWHGEEPMSSYLAVVAIGDFAIRERTVAGIPAWIAIDRDILDSSARGEAEGLRAMPRIHRLFAKRFGPYPFSSTGAIVDRAGVSYALETQTRSAFDGQPGDALMAHEIAHQWFGDSVGLERWPDIWLNEGFATWAQWFWVQKEGRESLRARLVRNCEVPASNDSLWRPPPAYPGNASRLFSLSIYNRGGLALEALRQRISPKVFNRVMRRWATDHRYGSVGLLEFQDLAEEVSGQQLDRFFDDWLRDPKKPSGCARYVR
ncbi:M1 family metallopeptidase [Thermoleophilia bacterium SCSIO 60948]|nr:M1 family metallopeptidase [Thermoleophilia bacterium SCSIO 60948]